MQLRVLGSAAGGGFPQWNCGCANCSGVRAGTLRARPRTQECVAVSADGRRWVLLNASPEIRAQLESFPALWPRAPRHSPVAAVALTNGDLDHTLGLLSLRESYPISVYATAAVRDGFREGNALYRTLERFPDQVSWSALELGREAALADTGLFATAFPISGQAPDPPRGRARAVARGQRGPAHPRPAQRRRARVPAGGRRGVERGP